MGFRVHRPDLTSYGFLSTVQGLSDDTVPKVQTEGKGQPAPKIAECSIFGYRKGAANAPRPVLMDGCIQGLRLGQDGRRGVEHVAEAAKDEAQGRSVVLLI